MEHWKRNHIDDCRCPRYNKLTKLPAEKFSTSKFYGKNSLTKEFYGLKSAWVYFFFSLGKMFLYYSGFNFRPYIAFSFVRSAYRDNVACFSSCIAIHFNEHCCQYTVRAFDSPCSGVTNGKGQRETVAPGRSRRGDAKQPHQKYFYD